MPGYRQRRRKTKRSSNRDRPREPQPSTQVDTSNSESDECEASPQVMNHLRNGECRANANYGEYVDAWHKRVLLYRLNLEEREVVRLLSRHFGFKFEIWCNYHRISTIEDLKALLADFEEDRCFYVNFLPRDFLSIPRVSGQGQKDDSISTEDSDTSEIPFSHHHVVGVSGKVKNEPKRKNTSATYPKYSGIPERMLDMCTDPYISVRTRIRHIREILELFVIPSTGMEVSGTVEQPATIKSHSKNVSSEKPSVPKVESRVLSSKQRGRQSEFGSAEVQALPDCPSAVDESTVRPLCGPNDSLTLFSGKRIPRNKSSAAVCESNVSLDKSSSFSPTARGEQSKSRKSKAEASYLVVNKHGRLAIVDGKTDNSQHIDTNLVGKIADGRKTQQGVAAGPVPEHLERSGTATAGKGAGGPKTQVRAAAVPDTVQRVQSSRATEDNVDGRSSSTEKVRTERIGASQNISQLETRVSDVRPSVHGILESQRVVGNDKRLITSSDIAREVCSESSSMDIEVKHADVKPVAPGDARERPSTSRKVEKIGSKDAVPLNEPISTVVTPREPAGDHSRQTPMDLAIRVANDSYSVRNDSKLQIDVPDDDKLTLAINSKQVVRNDAKLQREIGRKIESRVDATSKGFDGLARASEELEEVQPSTSKHRDDSLTRSLVKFFTSLRIYPKNVEDVGVRGRAITISENTASKITRKLEKQILRRDREIVTEGVKPNDIDTMRVAGEPTVETVLNRTKITNLATGTVTSGESVSEEESSIDNVDNARAGSLERDSSSYKETLSGASQGTSGDIHSEEAFGEIEREFDINTINGFRGRKISSVDDISRLKAENCYLSPQTLLNKRYMSESEQTEDTENGELPVCRMAMYAPRQVPAVRPTYSQVLADEASNVARGQPYPSCQPSFRDPRADCAAVDLSRAEVAEPTRVGYREEEREEAGHKDFSFNEVLQTEHEGYGSVGEPIPVTSQSDAFTSKFIPSYVRDPYAYPGPPETYFVDRIRSGAPPVPPPFWLYTRIDTLERVNGDLVRKVDELRAEVARLRTELDYGLQNIWNALAWKQNVGYASESSYTYGTHQQMYYSPPPTQTHYTVPMTPLVARSPHSSDTDPVTEETSETTTAHGRDLRILEQIPEYLRAQLDELAELRRRCREQEMLVEQNIARERESLNDKLEAFRQVNIQISGDLGAEAEETTRTEVQSDPVPSTSRARETPSGTSSSKKNPQPGDPLYRKRDSITGKFVPRTPHGKGFVPKRKRPYIPVSTALTPPQNSSDENVQSSKPPSRQQTQRSKSPSPRSQEQRQQGNVERQERMPSMVTTAKPVEVKTKQVKPRALTPYPRNVTRDEESHPSTSGTGYALTRGIRVYSREEYDAYMRRASSTRVRSSPRRGNGKKSSGGSNNKSPPYKRTRSDKSSGSSDSPPRRQPTHATSALMKGRMIHVRPTLQPSPAYVRGNVVPREDYERVTSQQPRDQQQSETGEKEPEPAVSGETREKRSPGNNGKAQKRTSPDQRRKQRGNRKSPSPTAIPEASSETSKRPSPVLGTSSSQRKATRETSGEPVEVQVTERERASPLADPSSNGQRIRSSQSPILKSKKQQTTSKRRSPRREGRKNPSQSPMYICEEGRIFWKSGYVKPQPAGEETPPRLVIDEDSPKRISPDIIDAGRQATRSFFQSRRTPSPTERSRSKAPRSFFLPQRTPSPKDKTE